jgi:hypothetical protein
MFLFGRAGIYERSAEGQGGTVATAADPAAGGEAEAAEDAEAEGSDAGAEGAEEEAGAGEGQEDETAGEGKADGGKPAKPAAVVKPTEKPAKTKGAPPESVPYARVQELSQDLQETRRQLQQHAEEIKRLKGPEKDPIDLLAEQMPEGLSEEDQEAWKKDVQTIAPLFKHFRKGIIGDISKTVDFLDKITLGLTRSFDKLRFMNDGVLEFVNQVAEAATEGDVAALKRIQIPAKIKYLSRVEETVNKAHKDSGGKKFLPYDGGFRMLQEQLAQEERDKNRQESTIREDERNRTVRQEKEKRSASGAPGNRAGAAPRGAAAPKGPRTPEQIQKDIDDGKDYRIE